MTWQYNYTSRMYQRKVGNDFLAITPDMKRIIEDKDNGWLPIQGIALDYLWNEGRWTCQEHFEYDSATRKYQGGTRMWRNLRDKMEFKIYQPLDVRLLLYEEMFKTPEISRECQENVAGFFTELKKRQRFKN